MRHSGVVAAQHAAMVGLSFFALFAVLFSPVLLDGGLLGTTDAVIYYYPAWSTHHFGWTPNLYAGYPVGGDPQSMFWYPLTWITRGLGSWNVFVISAYALAASFAYGYANRLTHSRLAARVAGLTYGMSGFAISHLDHVSIIHTVAWAPLVLWSLEAQRERASRAWLAAGAFGIGNAALAGHPQVFVYLVALALVYALVRARGDGGGGRYLLRVATSIGLGVALAAVMLVPMLELASRSLRGAMTHADFFLYALQWAQLPQLVVPHVFGAAFGAPGASPALPYFGPGIEGEVVGFVGVVPLMLAAIACVVAFTGRSASIVRLFSGVGVASLLLALGDNAWISEPLFYLPGYNRFRIPTRHLFELSLAIAVLAAFGVASLERMARARRVRVVAWATAAAFGIVIGACALAGLAIAQGSFGEEMYRAGVTGGEAMPWRNPAVRLQAAVVALGLVGVLAWARGAGRVTAAVLVAAVAMDLGSYAAFSAWRMSASPAQSFAMPRELAPLRAELAASGQRMTALTFDAPATAAPPNRNDLWQIPGALGYGPLPLADYAALLGLSAAHFRGPEELARVLGVQDRSLDVLATRYVLVPDDTIVSDARSRRSEFLRATREAVPQWKSVRDFLDRNQRFLRRPSLPGTAVYENTRALPRAWVVGEVAVATQEQNREAIRTGRLPRGGRFDARRVALVEEPVPGVRRCESGCGTVEITEREDRMIVLSATAKGDAFLVSSDVYYPGWRAWLDGARVPIYRTDSCLRGVALPAGTHEVRFVFEPESLSIGAALSLASAASLLGVLFWRGPRRRGERGAER